MMISMSHKRRIFRCFGFLGGQNLVEIVGIALQGTDLFAISTVPCSNIATDKIASFINAQPSKDCIFEDQRSMAVFEDPLPFYKYVKRI